MARKKRAQRKERYFHAGLLLIIPLLLFGIVSLFSLVDPAPTGHVVDVNPNTNEIRSHSHVDFKVFMNGEEVNFNQQRYNEKHHSSHLHLGNPDGDKVIHFEGSSTIGFFFESIGVEFTERCFIHDREFCDDQNNILKFFVNGEENKRFYLYVPEDLDRILISYGDESNEELQEQIENVTDFACIYSQKCPDRIPSLAEGQELLF